MCRLFSSVAFVWLIRDARITTETWRAVLDDFVDDAELVARIKSNRRGNNRSVMISRSPQIS